MKKSLMKYSAPQMKFSMLPVRAAIAALSFTPAQINDMSTDTGLNDDDFE